MFGRDALDECVAPARTERTENANVQYNRKANYYSETREVLNVQ